ncbi:MAG: GNAT family N-acetyltransferase [Phycisphaerales bacterium JB037]
MTANSPSPVTIRPADPCDADAWSSMRKGLGPDWLTDFDRHIAEYFAHGTIQSLRHLVLIAEDDMGPVGLAEVSLRDYAEGCDSSPVGFLEGWFVAERARNQGLGRLLVAQAEQWASEQGCTEFASDAELHNAASLHAHERLGFEPVCDIRCFRKDIASAAPNH